MKSTILTLWIILSGTGLWAQPVFEHKYDESVNVCYLESVGEVYYAMDVINKQCHLYRMDHTLYKSIPIPTPEGYYLSDVQFVTERLFNDDPLVELVYSYTKYVPTTTSYYYTYETKLVNENGNVILQIPGAGYTNVIETPGHGKKFLVYEYNYSVIPYRTYTHVYSLPGSEINAAMSPASQVALPPAYPNPAEGLIHIPVMLPGASVTGSIEILDLEGRLLLSYPVTRDDEHVVLPTQSFAPGAYLYYIKSGDSRTGTAKFVVADNEGP
jgi:hypothetical protein